MNKKDIYAVISRYLAKSTREDDKENLQLWVDENEENKSLLEKLESHWNSPTQRKISILNSEEIKRNIWNRTNKPALFKISSAKKNYLLKYAAVLLVLICSLPVIYFQLNKNFSEQSTAKLISKSNNAGRKSIIYLKDGTVVNLNSESNISYYETFSDTARFIWLTGEAFFDIAHDESKPFYVISQNVKIEAVGTSFNISGYSDADLVEVSLATGKVLVNSNNVIGNGTHANKIELTSGQKVAFQKATNNFSTVTTFDALEVEGWKNGTLYFKQARLDEIITTLERWYGVEIKMNSTPTKEISYTGVFKRQSLNNVLASIGFVTNFDFSINDKNVMLNFKNK